jgi:hypothetical protein
MSRNITNTGTKIFINTVGAREPLELLTTDNTSSTMTLKGLNGFTANKIIKVNSAGNALEYADDSNTEYTFKSPLALTGTEVKLGTINNSFGSAGQIFRSTGTDIEYSNVCNLQNILTTKSGGGLRFYEYTENDGAGTTNLITLGNATDNLKFINKNFNILLPEQAGTVQLAVSVNQPLLMASDIISLRQNFFDTITEYQTDDFIPIFDSEGELFQKIEIGGFTDLINYSALSPLAKDTTNDRYFFDISNLTNQAAIGNTATFFISNTGNNDAYRKLTFLNLKSSLITEGLLSTAVNFGTDTGTSGTRTLGLSTQNTDIKGAFINNIGTSIGFQVGSSVLGVFNSSNLTLNTGTLLRMGNNTVLTNSFSDVWTDCNIQTDKDIHLYSVGQSATGSMNKISFIGGSSEEILGTIGYTGSSITVANGGTPQGASSINAMFINATGSGANIAMCITPVETDKSTKVSKMIINATSTTHYNPVVLNNHLDTSINLDLILKCSGTPVFVCDFSARRHLLIGRGAFNYAGYSFQTALTILNNADDSSSSDFYQDCRMRLESVKNTAVPVIELVVDKGTNSGTINAGYLFIDGDGSIFLNTGGSNTKKEVVINGQALRTNDNVYFTNLSSAVGKGVYFIQANDETSTSTNAWKLDVGNSSGQLHFKAGTNATAVSTIVGFVSPSVSPAVQMNFTGQHRCVPENEELYNDVNNYIGMIVESTGQFNSIFTEEIEEDIELIDNIPEKIDISTNTVINQAYTTKENIKRKNYNMITTNEPTINEAQPIVKLTTTAKSKKVYGVISNKEDGEERTFGTGCFISNYGERKDNRLFINSIGEGGILVNSENGNIENGDLLCSSSTPGIAMKQDTDFIMNYTIGKATMDYNFTGNENKLIGCVYYCG